MYIINNAMLLLGWSLKNISEIVIRRIIIYLWITQTKFRWFFKNNPYLELRISILLNRWTWWLDNQVWTGDTETSDDLKRLVKCWLLYCISQWVQNSSYSDLHHSSHNIWQTRLL